MLRPLLDVVTPTIATRMMSFALVVENEPLAGLLEAPLPAWVTSVVTVLPSPEISAAVMSSRVVAGPLLGGAVILKLLPPVIFSANQMPTNGSAGRLLLPGLLVTSLAPLT